MTPEQQRMFMAYQQWMMQGSSPINGQLGMALMPQLDKKIGDTNYQQDRMQMLGDPFSGFLAGPGAADYRTLQPTIEREIVKAPGLTQLNSWLGSGQDTAYQIMAEAMRAGASVNEAWKLVQKNVEDFPDGVAAMSLPPGETADALNTLYEQAYDLDNQINIDKAAGASLDRFDPATGAFFNETETPSEMKQMFTDMGLPSPDERYEVDPYAEQMGLAMEGQGYAGPMEMESPYWRQTDSAGNTVERPDLNEVGLAEHSAILNSRLTGNDAAQRAIEEEIAALALAGTPGVQRELGPRNEPFVGGADESMSRIGDYFGPGYEPPQTMDMLDPITGQGTMRSWSLTPVQDRYEDIVPGENDRGSETPRITTYEQAELDPMSEGYVGGRDDNYGFNMSNAPWQDALRRKSLAEAGQGREGKRSRFQQDIFEGVRERKKIRKQADPGSRNAIAAAAMKGRNARPGQNLTLSDSGMSFHTAEEAMHGLRAYVDAPAGSDPFTDAMRERMLYSQLNGF